MQYTQCKIVGNGSFGVVFQTKMSPSGEDAAIKRVLQDKRFKVGFSLFFFCFLFLGAHDTNHKLRIVNCKSCVLYAIPISLS
jgi:hypothetical protein